MDRSYSNYLLFLYDVRGGAGLFLLRLYVQEECIWHAFLKTGFNGVRYFENAVLVDILIRPLRIGITILIASIPFIKFGVNIWSIFDSIMVSSIVSVGSLNIFRYMDLGMYIYVLALIVIFPAIAGSIAVLIYGGKMWFIAPVLAVVLVGVIAATYYHMLVRIRRSYVDV